MFGYVTTDLRTLDKEERKKYRDHYCGLCHVLEEKYGKTGISSLSYDMVFLEMVLSDLTDAEEFTGEEKCAPHPLKSHDYVYTACTDYAADMQMLLRYYSVLDSVLDDGRGQKKEKQIQPFLPAIEEKYPRQANAVKTQLNEIMKAEKAGLKDPELMSLEFGKLLGEVFVWDESSFFRDDLRAMGCALGRFIYILDAWCDRKKDARKDSYNPLRPSDDKDKVKAMLFDAAASASSAFERLPLDQHVAILSNILYSGIWFRFERGKKDE